MDRRARLYIYWIPPIVWAVAIFAASTSLFTARHTGSVLEAIIITIVGHPLKSSQFNVIHFLVRKAGHLTEYAIFGALLFRAIRNDRRGWSWRWALAAIAIAALYAATDEFHQSFVPGRTPSVWDVLIDTTGATLAQVLFFRR